MNNTFPTLEEIQTARNVDAPLTAQQMLDRIADGVRNSIKQNPHSTFVNVKFPEFASCNSDYNFNLLCNEVCHNVPSHYDCKWIWTTNTLLFTIRWN
jgi:hypothetical protein